MDKRNFNKIFKYIPEWLFVGIIVSMAWILFLTFIINSIK